ncbi:MAG: hypothetical protein KF749_15990 [Bacteroidetes bacterium]|nr:hypothetical protein [Bacteroidota bacterium]MCW5894183.1 hypothetical protein [Bacteroidota bacterium]
MNIRIDRRVANAKGGVFHPQHSLSERRNNPTRYAKRISRGMMVAGKATPRGRHRIQQYAGRGH